jgi:POT family proton-dependent oligopeptide transporter
VTSPERASRLPPQIPFIIGNEACERFSFYGMRNILTVFLIDWLLRSQIPSLAQREAGAKAVFHLFVFGVYFTPLLGGFLADRFLGKYRTILYLSLFYCAGHACLALFHDGPMGFYTGLALIALGSGGIKPCVSALVGDQFTAENKQLVNKVYAVFYFPRPCGCGARRSRSASPEF